MNVVIVDYGVGNLYSIRRSLSYLDVDCAVSGDASVLAAADRLILPGVGAFGDAMARLRADGLDAVVVKKAREGTPLLGICLGMQMLFEKSAEYGEHAGLSLLSGGVCALRGAIPEGMKVPHIGWNALSVNRAHPLLGGARKGDCVYYVHSYYARARARDVIADSDYGVQVPGLVACGNVAGAQFHPEKSGRVGLEMLRAFARWEGEDAC